jgi:hypothetical protein
VAGVLPKQPEQICTCKTPEQLFLQFRRRESCGQDVDIQYDVDIQSW